MAKYNVKLLKRFKERNINTPETMDMVSEETEQQSEVYITEEEINDRYFYPVDKNSWENNICPIF